MYVLELQFECFDNTTVSAVDKAVSKAMDALRYNGQVLGREFPIVMGGGLLCSRCAPEQDSFTRVITLTVKVCFDRLSNATYLRLKCVCLAEILTQKKSSEDEAPSWQVLCRLSFILAHRYVVVTAYFAVPLYRNPPTFNGDHKAVLKWH